MTEEELKQEAESKLDEWSDPDMGCCEGYCYSEVADFMFRFSEPREKRIEELEKENAELKEKLKPENCLKLLAKDGYVKFTSDQLTKAKELEYAKTIIQDLLDNSDEYARERAINFLKEVKK